MAVDQVDMQRKLLADFLRAKREQSRPEDIGVPFRRSRRRVKGLTREEVAELAGISVTWYTWIEQAREISVSTETLERIAEAMRLDVTEVSYLRSLAEPALAVHDGAAEEIALPNLQLILNSLETSPAQLFNHKLDILGSNEAARRVYPDHTLLPVRQRNVAWQVFLNPAVRQLIVDWERNARGVVGLLRAAWAQHRNDPDFAELISELQLKSPEFRDWWGAHRVTDRPIERKELNHPLVGRLVFYQQGLLVQDHPDLTLVLYTPWPGSGTIEKVRRLTTPTRTSESMVTIPCIGGEVATD